MDSRINVDQRLAESFKQLLIKNPIEKITIKDITDGAGVIRPTFYNHFQDKYDLLEWIVKHELLGPFFPQLKRGHLEDGLILIFTNALQMKEFCIRAAKMDTRHAAGGVKVINLSSNIGSLVTQMVSGYVYWGVGLIAAVASIAGHYIGSGLAIKNGSKIVRPTVIIVLILLTVKVGSELLFPDFWG